MKRTIYRGYNNKIGWVKGTAYLHFNDRPFNADVFDATKRDFIFVQKFGSRAGFVAVDPASVGVFTGAYDNWHKMIFKGDIVEVKPYMDSCKVVYSVVEDSNGSFKLVSDGDWAETLTLSNMEARNMKIVDNIYKLYDLKDKE